MTLRKWIEGNGFQKSADILGVQRPNIYIWYRYSGLPKAKIMARIVKITKGRVSYREMIEDFLKNAHS